jgi:hypothetical protein
MVGDSDSRDPQDFAARLLRMNQPPLLHPASRFPRGLRVAGWICLGILAAAFAWHLAWRAGNAQAQSRCESEIRQRGHPLTLEELAARHPPIPAERNAAEALMDVWERDNPALWRAFRTGAERLPERNTTEWDPALPFLGAKKTEPRRTAALDPESRRAADIFVRNQASRLTRLQASLARPDCRFPVIITNGFAALLPHLSAAKQEALRLRVMSAVATDEGRVDEAITAMNVTTQLARHLTREPFLISQLVCVALMQGVLDDVSRLLSRQTLTASDLTALEAVIRRTELSGALEASLFSEIPAGMSVFSMSSRRVAKIFLEGGEGYSESGWKTAVLVLDVTGGTSADRRLYLETMVKLSSLATNASPTAIEEFQRVVDRAATEARRFPPRLLSTLLLPALGKVPQKFLAIEARRRAAMVALAIERHRLAHGGQIPGSLGTVSAEFLPAIPTDPFDGQPLRYRTLGHGYVVYSVGQGLQDNNGKERSKTPKDKSVDDDETFFVER